jgi:hypothetical protein
LSQTGNPLGRKSFTRCRQINTSYQMVFGVLLNFGHFLPANFFDKNHFAAGNITFLKISFEKIKEFRQNKEI